MIENVGGEACAVCGEWDGKVISITGLINGYPSYAEAMQVGWGGASELQMLGRARR